MKKSFLNKLPTVPQYYAQYVNSKVDLNETPYQACPFHGETNGKSFSYSKQLGIWRCFGACHCGGDVIDLHKLNYHLKTYEEAAKSLCQLLGISIDSDISFEAETIEVDQNDVYRRRILTCALNLAHTVDDYVELDYIVSKVPYDVKDLELYCSVRGYLISKDTGIGGNDAESR